MTHAKGNMGPPGNTSGLEEIQGEGLCCPFALTGQSLSGRAVVKAAATTGSSIHILLIPERHLPYRSQRASGKDSESPGSKRGELENAQSWQQAGQGLADVQLQERGPLLKESWGLRLA